MVNIFSDIVVESFRLERSAKDEKKVLMGWRALESQELMPLEKIILGFLREFWGAPLRSCSRPEVDLLCQLFSVGIGGKEPLAQAMPRDGPHTWTPNASHFR